MDRREVERLLEEFKGRYALIYTLGMQQEVAPKDTIHITKSGIWITHNDPKDSKTFIPWLGIHNIRTYDK